VHVSKSKGIAYKTTAHELMAVALYSKYSSVKVHGPDWLCYGSFPLFGYMLLLHSISLVFCELLRPHFFFIHCRLSSLVYDLVWLQWPVAASATINAYLPSSPWWSNTLSLEVQRCELDKFMIMLRKLLKDFHETPAAKIYLFLPTVYGQDICMVDSLDLRQTGSVRAREKK
jgi:hypothetical protein